MQTQTIITCALTGSFDTVGKNPAVPVTPAAIADSAIEAAKAGAAIVHIHVRDPKTTAASMDLQLYREVVDRIRSSSTDCVINLTTGAGGRYVPREDDPLRGGPGSSLSSPERRVEHVVELRPEICTLDMGTMNFGESAFINTPPHLRRMADMIRAAGVRPEIEVFDMGHIQLARQLIREGHLGEDDLFQLCLGIPHTAPATADALVYMRNALPQGARWGAFGVGAQEFPIAAMTAAMGGNIRVGLEDNLYISRGKLAPDNATLVRRAVAICETLNLEPATAQQARAILGLSRAAN